MDMLKNIANGKSGNADGQQKSTSDGPGSFLGGLNKLGGGQHEEQHRNEGSSGGLLGKFNGMAGGGKQGEKNEDMLDKGIDFVQEKFLGQGPQNNESATEQAKDETISDFIRDKYKQTTGKDFPIADKKRTFGGGE